MEQLPTICVRPGQNTTWTAACGCTWRPKCSSWTSSASGPMDRDSATAFFTLVSARYERGSIILTSNKGFGEWGELLGDTIIASAILDRLLHHSHVLNIRGESYRLKEKRQAGLFSSHQVGRPSVGGSAGNQVSGQLWDATIGSKLNRRLPATNEGGSILDRRWWVKSKSALTIGPPPVPISQAWPAQNACVLDRANPQEHDPNADRLFAEDIRPGQLHPTASAEYRSNNSQRYQGPIRPRLQEATCSPSTTQGHYGNP